VTSNPPGAKAVLDGNLGADCRTPCFLHALPGRHTLTVSQAGYLNEYRSLDVGDKALDVDPIVLRQPEAEGTMFLSTTPPGAFIRIDGRAIPQLTNCKVSLAPGTHTVTVEKNGIVKTQSVHVGDTILRVSIPLDQ
jgi:hypothetical protein